MALPPKFNAHRLTFSSSLTSAPEPKHTIELFLDYVCPFSAKLFNNLYNNIIPKLISPNPSLSSKVDFIIRQQIQPWHPSSTLVHEAALAVLQLTNSPAKFYQFSSTLFAHQKSYFDISLVNETRNQTYRRLAKLASDTISDLDEEAVYNLLAIPSQPGEDGALNAGNAVTNDVKLITKINRLLGVHVTPTVIFNGVVANEISSGWTEEQWKEWLDKNIV
ncbi:uncharacterized protein QC761_106500 [Podospora bellae-mahoneyi]|uniref:Thioredoxin-like fold domain-containing protein n=1 Tax=Podospora bellae-mahoneyi TaxID=2093777 RepID=A0ABR0FX20_9PEZI|nr:hypothetical protein QC761_106500 [Podospora bellae-mahoneyi]